MVYNGKPYWNWMIWGCPYFREHPYGELLNTPSIDILCFHRKQATYSFTIRGSNNRSRHWNGKSHYIINSIEYRSYKLNIINVPSHHQTTGSLNQSTTSLAHQSSEWWHWRVWGAPRLRLRRYQCLWERVFQRRSRNIACSCPIVGRGGPSFAVHFTTFKPQSMVRFPDATSAFFLWRIVANKLATIYLQMSEAFKTILLTINIGNTKQNI